MFKARIADFNILFEEHYNRLYINLGDFAAEFDKPEFYVKTTLEDILHEEEISDCKTRPYRYELACAFRYLANQLYEKDACVLHSCFVKVADKGIAFTARSGTGKTTHMGLWQKMLGDSMEIINGDKPVVRFIDGIPYGYGTPWNGKEKLGGTGRAPLTDICLIERSETNETVPMSKEEGLMLLMQQIYMPETTEAVSKTMELIGQIVDRCNFWRIKCNMEPDAATTAYNAIFNKENK